MKPYNHTHHHGLVHHVRCWLAFKMMPKADRRNILAALKALVQQEGSHGKHLAS